MTIATTIVRSLWSEPSDRNRFLVLGGFAAALLVTAYLALVAPGASYTKLWLIDVMGLAGAAYRTYLGQFPSFDFYSGVGFGVYYPAALGFALGLSGGTVLAFGQVVVAAILLLPAVVICRSRLALLPAGMLLLFLAVLIVAPMNLGGSPFESTFGVYYNRRWE